MSQKADEKDEERHASLDTPIRKLLQDVMEDDVLKRSKSTAVYSLRLVKLKVYQCVLFDLA